MCGDVGPQGHTTQVTAGPSWRRSQRGVRRKRGPVTRDGRGDVTGRGGESKRPALSHHRQNPATLLLVDSHDVGNGVEILLSQNLFGCLWQQHSVKHGGQERKPLGKRAASCPLWLPGSPAR